MARIVIRNEDQLNEALDRAIHLAGSAKGGNEERELNAINEAVELYEHSLAVTAASGRSERKTKDDVHSGTGSE